MNLAVTGAEVDFSRVPSLRVPPLVTVPSRKGALMLDSPLPKVEPKAVKGGGRSTGTVDVAAITVGGSLGSPDDAFDPGFVVDAVPPPGVPDSSDPAPPAVPPSPITMVRVC